MIKEWDSEQDLKHHAKLLRGHLRPVRDYVDPYSEFNEYGTVYEDHMKEWPEP